jgi:hypothetical protein
VLLKELLQSLFQKGRDVLKVPRNRGAGRVAPVGVDVQARFIECRQDSENSNVWLNND